MVRKGHSDVADILSIARRYLDAGYSVVPIRRDGSKRPDGDSWKEYQKRKPTDEELVGWFASGLHGIGLVQGEVSGRSECLDFDEPAAWAEWRELCDDHGFGPLVDSLVVVETPSGGKHAYYRSPVVAGSKVLARLPDQKVKIETRAEGGQAVAPGSPADCHLSGKPYRLVSGSFASVPIIATEERDALHSMAKACTEWAEPARKERTTTAEGRPAGSRLGDDYDRRTAQAEVLDTLLRHGWTDAGRNGDAVNLIRPGKGAGEGLSATLGYVAPNVFYVFSTNALPFEPDTSYSPFQVFGLLECGGDFRRAASELAKRGFGEPTPPGAKDYAEINFDKYTQEESPQPRRNGVSSEDPAETPNKDAGFPHTELGNAERMLALFPNQMRYCPATGWLVWDKKRWATDTNGKAIRRMKATVRSIGKDTAEINRQLLQSGIELEERKELEKKRTAIEAWARRSEAARVIQAGLMLAQSEPGTPVEFEELDADPWLINCQNGTLCLKTGELLPHNSAHLITKILPVGYDPEADAPIWDRFLARIIPNEKVRGYIKRAIGYSLTGSVREQCMYFLHGSGSNGKSTLIKTVLRLIGPYGQQASAELLIATHSNEVRDDVASLPGKRLVATIETNKGRVMAEALMKQLTGGDRIRARKLYHDGFEFDPTHKIWFAANDRPAINGVDYGVWRRIKLIQFDQKISEDEKDPDLENKLAEELPGILRWAVDGCIDYVQNGMQEPDEVRAAVQDYQTESDQVGQFLKECCRMDKMAQTKASELFDAYCHWSESRRERPKNITGFGRYLAEKGFSKEKHRIGIVYTGIALETGTAEISL